MKLLSLSFVGLTLATTLFADPVAIVSYDITDAVLSGHGNWHHTYSGTITPGISINNGGFAGTAGTYTGGSGTLNDGVIANNKDLSQLFVQGGSASLNPVITLFLPGLYTINSISIYGGPTANSIPGCFTGVTVGIGGSSAAITTSGFGSNSDCSVPVNDLATITGSALAGVSTSTITLSQFTGPLLFNWFSITEIVVDGTPVASDVPEPASFGLIGAGLMLTVALKRR